MIALGVDVGGTFTDAVLVTDDGMTTAKVLSTPGQEEGVVAAAREALDRAGVAPGDVDHFVHGSTVATNALLTRTLARTALVTTKGFRDLLFLGRQARPSLYRLHEAPTPPVVERRRCVEVDERMGPDGVIRELDEASVERAARRLKRERAEAVAVCLLFAFLDPSHEARVTAMLRDALPDAFVVASHEVAAEVREFERATTATVDAALGPPTGRYLRRLREATAEAGLPAPHVMLSSGGVADLEQAAAHPAAMLLSGPAGGAVAARIVGTPPALGFDMGGTSCDTFLLGEAGGESELTVQRRVAGLPVRLPMVDIHTVSAGGGSIAWVDSGGALRVGPQSAGADPGPACYGRGGEQPTVTDANLVLGRLPADSPIAAGLRLDVDAARAALESLGVGTPEEAAAGVVAVAVNAMVQALRVVSVERGHDPAGAELIAFGGAGPLHACELAAQLGATRVLCLPASGVLSALGLAAAERRRDASRSLLRPLADAEGLESAVAELIDARDEEEVRGAADLRYAGQSFELLIPFGDGDLAEAFHAEHERRYGHADPDRPVELVTLRAAAVRPGADVRLSASGDVERGRRAIRWDGETVEAEVLTGTGLPPGTRVTGPAVVEFPETTCLVPPGWAGAADGHGVLRLEAT
ncbi:MAG TPA: hydantoinase/oxoprolinase family protein [Solirubrobacteraceae bacterium]